MMDEIGDLTFVMTRHRIYSGVRFPVLYQYPSELAANGTGNVTENVGEFDKCLDRAGGVCVMEYINMTRRYLFEYNAFVADAEVWVSGEMHRTEYIGKQLFSVKKEMRPCLYVKDGERIRYIGEYDYISDIYPNCHAIVGTDRGLLPGAWQFRDTTRMWISLYDDY